MNFLDELKFEVAGIPVRMVKRRVKRFGENVQGKVIAALFRRSE